MDTRTYHPVKGKRLADDTELAQYRACIEKREEEMLSPRAALSRDHSRPSGREDDHRLPYKRDVDRIVHSKAYSRYVDKTQVVYLVDNDHVTHRSLHVQLVSNFARGIAEILGLNVDLVEAIALGHDVGHPPFGHEGEGYLSVLSKEMGLGPFSHPWQSCRLLREVEPLNLGLAVYDGFLCHDGGMRETCLRPQFGKTWEDHQRDLDEKGKAPGKNISPTTLEGCLVKLCDTMSYLGRDIEDAISLKIIRREEVPETPLGRSNREFLSRVAQDIIACSYGKDYIALSEETFKYLKGIRSFNFKFIYNDARLKIESKKIKTAYGVMAEMLLKGFEREGEESHLWRHFLHNKPAAYREGNSPARVVVDYIAGMTDGYFVKTMEALVIPQRIHL